MSAQQDYMDIMGSFAFHCRTFPERREGQNAYNALYGRRSDIADKIRGTDVDPFHNDDRMPDFWDTVIELLHEEES